MLLKSLLIILVVVATIEAVKKSYDGYKLYQIVPKDDREVDVLKDVYASHLGEFWAEYFKAKDDVKVMVSPKNLAKFQEALRVGNVEAKEIISDIQKVINDQLKPASRSSSYLSYSWSEYHDIDAIYKWLDELETNHAEVKTVVMGKSLQNRDIKGIVINYHPERNNPIAMIEGTLHAREWISAATVTWFAKEFLTSTDPQIRALAENFEWHIFPVVNPDGYVYTFSDNRMWRKNRSPASVKPCAEGVDDDMSHGVDLNRNFDFEWGTVGASSDSCTNTYAGPSPASEPETQAIAQYTLALKEKGNFMYYLSYHSYTQLIIVPYSHVGVEGTLLSGNYGDMYEVAIRGSDAMRTRNGTNYRVGLSVHVLYPMSGSSFDWVKNFTSVPFSYLIELRDLERREKAHIMKFKEIFLILAVVAAINAEKVSYENYKVYKVVPGADNEVQILLDLQKNVDYMFLSDIVAKDSDVKIMVAPKDQEEFESYFKKVGIPTKVAIDNVQETIDDQKRRPLDRNLNNYAWNYYLSLEEINLWLDSIVQRFPDVVTPLVIGNSNEGRFLRGVKIDFKKQANPVIGMIEGGIHAREWISPATVTYIINEFLTSTNPAVRNLAENVVWHIFPIVNPDGYAYTFSDNRMWRKNRNRENYKSCGSSNADLSNGIDLNRNFGFVWMTVGASQNSCDETYAGPVEFSEPESRAIANYVLGLKAQGNFVYYLAFHSYSQMVLVPYSHVQGEAVLQAPHYANMYEIAIRGMDKLKEKYGTVYRVGTSAEILYAVSGSSFDWVKGVAEIPIVYLFELRDVGEYGFFLPPERIIMNNEEIMAGLLEMDRVTRDLGYYRAASSAGRLVASLALFLVSLLIAM
ncbi:unnamed protein product [Chrysodeixis includens]|uniref:Zinc carboxypeptidase A 1 n=1 Tax=Chrysodeixis includens TaxID=689277 RepID=A0A9P0BUA2_CHRIL|nr:unnamed protein product [Chrysodeixis includens]